MRLLSGQWRVTAVGVAIPASTGRRRVQEAVFAADGRRVRLVD
jgi:hypothetical protein